jgi:3'-phosphoadenosine 5'-phosphosulfate (PAPS) 3'-phosphatase
MRVLRGTHKGSKLAAEESMTHDRELQAALDAAQLASAALVEAYARFQVIADAPASISTDADRQSQEIILDHLHRLFPHDALCAEETTPTLATVPHTGERVWIVDPIDGTRGFARKVGEFSVMIALVQDGTVVLGVVQEPAKGRLTCAVRGGGCWRRDGTPKSPRGACACCSRRGSSRPTRPASSWPRWHAAKQISTSTPTTPAMIGIFAPAKSW